MKILKVNYSQNYEKGCETCDWGSRYINQFEVVFDDGIIKYEISNEYEYLLSEIDLIQLLANVNSKKEIEDKLRELIKNKKTNAWEGYLGINDKKYYYEQGEFDE